VLVSELYRLFWAHAKELMGINMHGCLHYVINEMCLFLVYVMMFLITQTIPFEWCSD